MNETPISASEARQLYERLLVAIAARNDLPPEFLARLETIVTATGSPDWQVSELKNLLSTLPRDH
jgi:hypothetical protein